MTFQKQITFLTSLCAFLSIQNYLLADCPNQDVICCLEHSYPLGGPIAYNQGTCFVWPSCMGIIPACCICDHEQPGLDEACRKAYPGYPADLINASLSQNCIPPTYKAKKQNHSPNHRKPHLPARTP